MSAVSRRSLCTSTANLALPKTKKRKNSAQVSGETEHPGEEKSVKTIIPVVVEPTEIQPAQVGLKTKEDLKREDWCRHGIVDVPILVDLVHLIGRCPLCERALCCPKVHKDDDGVVHLTLVCSNRCGFAQNWRSSLTTFAVDKA